MINTSVKVDTHNLYEIDKMLTHNSSNIEEVGESVNAIFYLLDNSRNITYINSLGKKWLGMDAFQSSIDLFTFFEDPSILGNETDCAEPRVSHQLEKVWFPNVFDYKLCLVSNYPKSNCTQIMFTVIPLQEWTYFQQKLTDLIEEETFVESNKLKYEALTGREKQVVKLISSGLSSKDISDHLCISKHTVEQHRKNVNRKLEISSLAELVKYGRMFSGVQNYSAHQDSSLLNL